MLNSNVLPLFFLISAFSLARATDQCGSSVSVSLGFKAAQVFSADSSDPILKPQIKITEATKASQKNQKIWFGKSLKSEKDTQEVGVQGIPTRLYLNPKNGEVAYINFDDQPVALIETQNPSAPHPEFKIIENPELKLKQDQMRHPGGFSTPVGPLKNSLYLSDLTLEQARQIIGREGRSAVLEYESGVVVSGTIESFTTSAYSQKLAVITFKDKTARVKFGVHTLYD
ncbi:MAG: hypothetical protein ACK5V3_13550, partial [Bdellovibrionales bacterium]